MPRQARGTIYRTKANGYGIRWREEGNRPTQTGFRTKTEARDWFDEHIGPRLRRGGPTADITLDAFCADYLERWGAEASPRTVSTIAEWLAPVRERFGKWTLAELEGAGDDISRWRSKLPTDHARYKHTRAMRQVLEAARRWGYIHRNPAVDIGSNPQPRGEEIRPFARAELDAVCAELADSPQDVAIVVFAAETGLRTNEWVATERRDIDRTNPGVAVARRYAEGQATPYPKTGRRRVPLTARAISALDRLPPRIDTPLLFAGEKGGHLNLNNWRNRTWYPALDAAGVERRGPYTLRHTFATNALAAGVSIFQLVRLMGTSTEMIERTYGHLAPDSEGSIRALLDAEADRLAIDWPSTSDREG